MDSTALGGFVGNLWDSEIVPQLSEYIRIPNKSPMFDAEWAAHGHMDRAVALMEAWARAQPIPGMRLEVVRLPGRTPLIFIEIPATGRGGNESPGQGDDTVLLYGHLDKQPEMTGWSDRLGPWTPVIDGDRLYGRGGADDGYAIFGSLAAIMALEAQNIPHARCAGISTCSSRGLISPVISSSSRDSTRRKMRKLDATTPDASPECTPSSSTLTTRLPPVMPRSEVVSHS
jgi:hypothetical protein